MNPTRVLVVEDSITTRKRLIEALSSDPSLQVVGEAADGRRAIELCRELRPDVISMDMVLPLMSGLDATQEIMAWCPTPILVVSSSENRGELFDTYQALAAGAIDVIEKPLGTEAEGEWESTLCTAIKIVSRVRPITHPRARLAALAVDRSDIASLITPSRSGHVVGIGASTGGPGAVVEVLRALPADFSTPVLLVLHINPSFAGAFIEWLAGQSTQPVRHARDGEALNAVRGVVVAPANQHLVVSGGRLRLSSAPERHSCRPSIDVLFESLARSCGSAATGCLLTGMGRDGALGLLEIRRAGGLTLAQDEGSCVVYGMPREAARLGAAVRVLPLSEIGPTLARLPIGLNGASST